MKWFEEARNITFILFKTYTVFEENLQDWCLLKQFRVSHSEKWLVASWPYIVSTNNNPKGKLPKLNNKYQLVTHAFAPNAKQNVEKLFSRYGPCNTKLWNINAKRDLNWNITMAAKIHKLITLCPTCIFLPIILNAKFSQRNICITSYKMCIGVSLPSDGGWWGLPSQRQATHRSTTPTIVQCKYHFRSKILFVQETELTATCTAKCHISPDHCLHDHANIWRVVTWNQSCMQRNKSV